MVVVQLIQPERSPGYADNSRSGCYVPLGLVSIATYIKQEVSFSEVEVIDGELLSNQEIIARLKPGAYIGIDTKTPNYFSALQIARYAKKKGCKVILGGVYASAIPHTITKHSSDLIDHIVVGYGEKAFADIINGKKDKIIEVPISSFDELPIPDRNLVNFEKYIQHFKEQHPTWNWRGTNIFTHTGCKYDCLFCSRTGTKKIVYRNPELIWSEVRSLVEDHGIEYLVDFSDTITQIPSALRAIVESKPKDLNPLFHVFSTADGINQETIELLKRLNTKHVFVGAETGDKVLAKTIEKGRNYSPNLSLEAITLLSKEGIDVTPSFVLGLPGETEQSLNNTLEFVKKIKDVSNFEEIFCSAFIPFPGSPAFKILEERKLLPDTDIFDPEELKKIWIKESCEVDYETIIECVDKILELASYKITIKKN
ncbi:B12-binding domain-containing radical SAM protein [archaeon]|nr:B12-binding domain-containing radical SAM protein [archaeon]MBL7056896.1 B12-binding domain-containing radical SAM protein [Candidatus Woesearchaeota archaeon]